MLSSLYRVLVYLKGCVSYQCKGGKKSLKLFVLFKEKEDVLNVKVRSIKHNKVRNQWNRKLLLLQQNTVIKKD